MRTKLGLASQTLDHCAKPYRSVEFAAPVHGLCDAIGRHDQHLAGLERMQRLAVRKIIDGA
ncbi:hypothetical protein D3C83_268140 [compost metagenome]